jgi:hypothetical protein
MLSLALLFTSLLMPSDSLSRERRDDTFCGFFRHLPEVNSHDARSCGVEIGQYSSAAESLGTTAQGSGEKALGCRNLQVRYNNLAAKAPLILQRCNSAQRSNAAAATQGGMIRDQQQSRTLRTSVLEQLRSCVTELETFEREARSESLRSVRDLGRQNGPLTVRDARGRISQIMDPLKRRAEAELARLPAERTTQCRILIQRATDHGNGVANGYKSIEDRFVSLADSAKNPLEEFRSARDAVANLEN